MACMDRTLLRDALITAGKTPISVWSCQKSDLVGMFVAEDLDLGAGEEELDYGK